MKRSVLVAAFALSTARFAHALPPPVPPPPLSPEVQTAADALAAALPIEDALNRSTALGSDGFMAYRVAELLIGRLDPHRHFRCERDILRQYLPFHIAPLLPAKLPRATHYLRIALADQVGRTMSVADLEASRAMVESPMGHALMLSTLAVTLRTNDEIVDLLASGLNDDVESLLRAAEADCRAAHGRPPPYID